MLNKRIIWTNQNGGTSILAPVESGLSIDEIAAKDVPPGAQWQVVDVATIPTDRVFRDAWKINGAAIEHDLVKAKEIAHARRRDMRQGEMAPLDLEATIPAKAVAAEAARAVLRTKYDLMQTKVDAAKNVADLKTALGLA